MPDNPIDPTDPFVSDLIRRTAARLGRRGQIPLQERHDIEQDLALHLVTRLRAFETRGGYPRAFVHTLVNRRVANILRARHAAKRDDRRVTSLDAQLARDDIPSDIAAGLASLHRDNDLAELALDVEVLTRLPWVTDGRGGAPSSNPSPGPPRLGIPRSRSTVGVRALLEQFEQARLRDYLSIPSDTSRARQGGSLVEDSSPPEEPHVADHVPLRVADAVPTAEIEGTLLLLAILAVESLHGESQRPAWTPPTLSKRAAESVRSTPHSSGRDLNRLFVGYARREFGGQFHS